MIFIGVARERWGRERKPPNPQVQACERRRKPLVALFFRKCCNSRTKISGLCGFRLWAFSRPRSQTGLFNSSIWSFSAIWFSLKVMNIRCPYEASNLCQSFKHLKMSFYRSSCRSTNIFGASTWHQWIWYLAILTWKLSKS